MNRLRHFLSITDFSEREILSLFRLTQNLKKQLGKTGKNSEFLHNKTLVMIYEKPSLRTRLSFEIGMTQLGGHAIYLGPSDIGLGKRESSADAARVVSRMGDIIMARTFAHSTIEELAKYSTIPVINALSDLEHPCQVLADYFTVLEHKKKLKGLTVAYVGDGENNVAHSLALGAGILGMRFRCASPKGYDMLPEVVKQAKKIAIKAEIVETRDPKEAVRNADVVVTDTWVSMGDEKEKEKRMKKLKNYQVNKKLMSFAKKDAIFLHCLPAYRGHEVTPDVIDGLQSVVWDEAENRLHVQKALMLWLLGARV